jgi:hypothetical protein
MRTIAGQTGISREKIKNREIDSLQHIPPQIAPHQPETVDGSHPAGRFCLKNKNPLGNHIRTIEPRPTLGY